MNAAPSIEARIDAAAAEAVFRLDIMVCRSDYADGFLSTAALSSSVDRISRRHRLPRWLVRSMIESADPDR